MAIQLSDNLHIAAGKPADSKYLNSSGSPYTGTSQVFSQVPLSERFLGLTVNVNKSEYWFKTGLTNTSLVVKQYASTGSTLTATNGLRKMGNSVVLGGTLTGNTTITNSNGYFLQFYNINPSGNFGQFEIDPNQVDIQVSDTSNNILDNNISSTEIAETLSTSNNNTVAEIHQFAKNVSTASAGANGHGVSLGFYVESATKFVQKIGSLRYKLTNATTATAQGQFEFAVTSGGTNNTTILSIDSKGAKYNADYSNGYTVRSLIDKGFLTGVTNTLLPKSSFNTFTASTVSNATNLIIATASTTIATTSANNTILVNSPNSVTLTLPASPADKSVYAFKDSYGNALSANITVNGNSKLIDGSATAVIDSNFGGFTVIYSSILNKYSILNFVV